MWKLERLRAAILICTEGVKGVGTEVQVTGQGHTYWQSGSLCHTRASGSASRLHKAFVPVLLAGGLVLASPQDRQLCPTQCLEPGEDHWPRCLQWPCSLRTLFPGGSFAPAAVATHGCL